MLKTEIIKKMKQSNISVDGENTKQRVKEVWTASKAQEKKDAAALAGVGINSLYRVINTGSISAKIAVALALTLNVNPFYLTGEAEESGECSEEVIKALFVKHNYVALWNEHVSLQKKAARKAKRESQQAEPPQEEIAEVAETETLVEDVPPQISENENASILAMPDEDVMLLVRSLKLKAGIGVQSAVEAVKRLDEILFV